MLNYGRSDLACEIGAVGEDEEGAYFSESEEQGYKVQTLEIVSERASEKLGKPVGRYITVTVGTVRGKTSAEKKDAVKVIGSKIREIAEEKGYKKGGTVLVCGLGNRNLTADCLGALCADRVFVTAHVKDSDPKLFSLLGRPSVICVSPGVASQTGIEAARVLRGICEEAKPSICIAVDALAARETARLVTTVQLCSCGLAPGSGVGNRRVCVDEENLGVPVISVGVPTVVDCASLVLDTLDRAGIEEVSDSLAEVLESSRGYFVSPGDADVSVTALAGIIAKAIDEAFMM